VAVPFAAVACLTLALDIDAKRTLFGVAYGARLRPLPCGDRSRLVLIEGQRDNSGRVTHANYSLTDLADCAVSERLRVGGDCQWPHGHDARNQRNKTTVRLKPDATCGTS
jgi:hypothetical protein